VRELGRMGQYVRKYRPKTLSYHRAVNDIFGSPSRQAFPPGAVVVQQKKIPDVSFWQEFILFSLMRLQTDALIIRAGQNTWVDTQFKRNWSEAKRFGIKRGAYYFYDDRVSPGKQAEIFISLLKDDLPELEIWCDWENSYGGAFGSLRDVVAFMEAVERALPTVKIGLYTGYWFFREHSNAITHASQYNYLKRRPLFLAWYTNNPANVLIPAPWSELFLWQFGTPAVGHDYGVGTKEIDMSYINMTEAEFKQRYGGEVIPPEEPTGGTMAKNKVTITWDQGARERKEPRVQVATETYRNILLDNSVHYSDVDVVPDTNEPYNPDKRWIKLQSGWYVATRYPSSTGNPTRATVEPVQPVGDPGEKIPDYLIAHFEDGTEKRYLPE
jgi:GH25 family lysozyme M1 (1,4-beta-N-acetylmuramidase)